MDETLTLTIRDCRYYPPAERDRDHTSYEVSRREMVFPDHSMAFDYLLYKGLSPERAALVLNRRCQFDVETDPDPLAFRLYKFERSAR